MYFLRLYNHYFKSQLELKTVFFDMILRMKQHMEYTIIYLSDKIEAWESLSYMNDTTRGPLQR